MNCEEAKNLVDGYLDGELDPITNQRIEQHLRQCADCEQAFQTHGSLLGAVGNATPYYKAPAGLRERIQSSLRKESGEAPIRNVDLQGEQRTHTVFSGTPWSWLALAAAIVFAAMIASNLVPRSGSGGDQFLASQLIASHARSLMANHLMDVASSDQHTVKPWLDAKLDFAPPVNDLSAEGFPLIGGRLDYLDNRPVAALVYQRRQHFINLFIWPTTRGATTGAKTITRQGYQLVHWADADFNYWAVSDVNANDLQTFKQQFEARTPHR